MTDETAPRDLMRFFAKHNRQALLLTFFSLVTALLLWGAIYLAVSGLAMLVVTLIYTSNPLTFGQIMNPNLLGPYFPAEFIAGACIYLIVAGIIRRTVRTDKVREAWHYAIWLMMEIFMAVPNVTFAVWGNFRARVHLRRREVFAAWTLLQAMKDNEGRLSMTSLRTVIEDERTLGRVLIALQLVELVGVRESEDEGWFLYLQNLDAFPALKPDLARPTMHSKYHPPAPDPTYRERSEETYYSAPDPTYPPTDEPIDEEAPSEEKPEPPPGERTF